MKKIDLTGQKYGQLKVVEEVDKIHRRVAWLCQCDCGKTVIRTTTYLRNHESVSCGCSRHEPLLANIKDITGQKFGKLTVLGRAERFKYGHYYWECLCDCGKKVLINGNLLRSGGTKSCGCSRLGHTRNLTHGFTSKLQQKGNRALYGSWSAMKRRCNNPDDKDYHLYGGRGINVCDRWQDFSNFREDMESSFEEHFAIYGKDTSIERIDNNKGYSPDNCKWATSKEQANNRRPPIRSKRRTITNGAI